MAKSKSKDKIYERNPDTGVIRWRYTDESPDKFGWPNYGRILKGKIPQLKKLRERSLYGDIHKTDGLCESVSENDSR